MWWSVEVYVSPIKCILLFTQTCVPVSPSPMEWWPTPLLMTLHQLEQWPLTLVTLAMNWVVLWRGIVWLSVDGVQLYLFAIVSWTNTCNSVLWIPCIYAAVNCGDLPNPTNRQVSTSSGTTFMMTAIYTCNPGYTLLGGSMTRICQANVLWSGAAPTCDGQLKYTV